MQKYLNKTITIAGRKNKPSEYKTYVSSPESVKSRGPQILKTKAHSKTMLFVEMG